MDKILIQENGIVPSSEEVTKCRESERTRTSWRFSIFFGAWLFLIFGTSCTVIRPNEFFSLVYRFTGAEQESMNRFVLFWGISWVAIVKGWHFTEFAILTIFCNSTVSWWLGKTTTWSIVVSMLFCIGFAASDEWHQTFVPDRFGTLQDVLIDSLGVFAVGVILLIRVKQRNAKSLSPSQ